MADRIEREIEEILSQIDDLPGEGKKPVSITARRKKPRATGEAGGSLVDRVDPAVLMIAGAAVMLGSLVVASFVEAFVWVALGGVVVFLGAFILAFFRKRPAVAAGGGEPTGPGGRRQVFWRDRYIEIEPERQGPVSRLRSKLKRR